MLQPLSSWTLDLGLRHIRNAHCAPIEYLENRLLLAANPYSFQNATIEGGGFVDGVFFSPTQQNVIYARTDIGGLYKTTNGGTTWHQLLDFVGSGTSTSGNGTQSQLLGVLSFAIDPENANNIYADVGQYSGTDGAVFYSTNGGTTWGQTNLSFYVGGNSNGRATGERIAVDPYDSNIVLLGSNANGLWKSTNAGHSFSQVSGFSTTAAITFVEFKPYGGTAGSPTQNIILGEDSTAGLSPQVAGNPPTNVYQSTNGGTSWSEISGTTIGLGKNVLSTSVTSLSRSGTTATVTTASATGFAAGDEVTIAGATPAAYDGTFTITAITNSTTFTFDGIASGTDTATGTITANANYSLIPNHAVWASDGNIYLTYSDGLAPSGTQDVGGVFRYNSSTGVWANISPQIPGAGTNPSFGYLGLALDPENNTTIAVTTINDYSGIDKLYRTTNASSSSPTWVSLYDSDSAQNHGYGGYDTTRNTTNAPWVAQFGDGIGNWAASVAIDPFNSAHLLYGDGEGIWATNDATSATELTAANSWYFPDYGIEFTAVNYLIAPGSGVPLFSGMGDINGFVHNTLTSSPSAGEIDDGNGPLDFDQANSNYVVDLGGGATGGIYSTNDGTTWTAFGSEAGLGGGTIAVSATAAAGQPAIVWSPSGALPYYSTNNGTTWTASTLPSGTLTDGTIISDRVNGQIFYYATENSSNSQLSVYESTNGGVTFSLAGQSSISESRIAANPFAAGDLWMANSTGLYHSTNFGASFANVNSSVEAGYSLALGAPAPGQTNAAVYLWGEIGGIVGLYRSDDSGATFIRINDTADQWGGRVGPLAADPNVFGRVYIGINGRGIIIGDPVSSLPTGWSDQDINTPGNPGFATSSTTLSNGTVVNKWIVDGGGAGIAGSSDQFNFAAEGETGNASILAQITGLDNAGTGTPQAGVMFRAGTSAAGDAFAAIVQSTANQLVFEYRATSGGTISSTTLSGVAIGAEYVDLVRSGTSFSAFYGADGTHWTQLGSTIAISAIPSTASVGLAVTSNYNPQLSSATFNGVQFDTPPTVVTPAASSASPVTTASTTLSVLGGDTDGQTNLTYTWATTGTPPAAVTFSANGTNAAQNTLATFTQPGNYSFIVAITNAAGESVTSTVSLTVVQTFDVRITPASSTVRAGSATQFSAAIADQFGTLQSSTQPTFNWTVSSGNGFIDNTGLFTAPSSGGTTIVQASSNSGSGTTIVTTAPALGIFTNDSDIGAPSPTGSASYAASTGVYTVTGGGADIWNTSDQFSYLYKSYSGNGAIIAQVTNLQDTNSWAKSAVMFRNSTAAGDAFVDVVASYNQGIQLQYRTTSGGSAASGADYTGIAAPVWIELVRSGSTFTGYYSTSSTFPTSWTSIGSIAVPNIATNALVGLAVTSHNNGTANTSTVSNVEITGTDQAPVVVVGAAASPAVVTGVSTNLSVLAADDAGPAGLTYTWTATPSSGVKFSANGTNAADDTTATFSAAGTYQFLVTVTNAGGLTTSSPVNVVVSQTPTSISLSPNTPTVGIGKTQQFIATAVDQFGAVFSPTLTWTATAGSNSAAGAVNGTGLFTAPSTTGTVTVQVSSGSTSASTTVNVVQPASVTSVVVNGNNSALAGVQRSMVDSIVYTFSEAVTLATTSAFNIAVHASQGGTLPTLAWAAINPVNNASTQWVVTFSGAGVIGGSIGDGVYDITLNSAAVTSAVNPTVPVTPRATDTFYRHFGEVTGDLRVNNADYNAFLTTYNLKSGQTGYLAEFDATGTGARITNADYNLFLDNYNVKLTGFTPTI